MQYQFFIQGNGTGSTDDEYRFIMVLDTSNRDSMAQSNLQALITRHQMHTCVNIPFRYHDGHTMKFKVTYADMDGEPHPVLVILTNRHGAFRLPFPAGVEGYRLFQKTYRDVKMRLIAHRNRHLSRIEQDTTGSRRLNGPAPKSSADDTAVSDAEIVEESQSRDAQPKKTTPSNKKAQQSPTPKPKPAENTKKKTSASTPSAKPTKSTSSLTHAGRWLVMGLSIGMAVVLALFAGKAMADEAVASPEQSERERLQAIFEAEGVDWDSLEGSHAGFAVPEGGKVAQATTSDGCGIPSVSTAGGSLFGGDVFGEDSKE